LAFYANSSRMGPRVTAIQEERLMLEGPPQDFGVLRYRSSRFKAPDRIDSWRQVMGRKLIRIEVDSLPNVHFHARSTLRIFETVRFGTGSVAPNITRRGPDIVALENDDLFLIVNLTATVVVRQWATELILNPGDACLLSCSDPWVYVQPKSGRVLCMRVARAPMASMLPTLEDKIGLVIRDDEVPLRILLDYLSSVDRTYAYPDGAMRATLSAHIHDLLALTLGAGGDGQRNATERGLRAARVRALKDDLQRNYTRNDLNLSEIAARHGLSRRSVQRIFEVDGSTFQTHLLALRLEGARIQLRNPRTSALTIAQIAANCGFGDISHFNHSFRKRFGESPSDMRFDWRDEEP